ncbi:MAG: putative histidine kinase, hybrid [Polaromonas sp.]|nr:putative histidine kinase, hybrid [Polaromonas sp.]
MAGIALLALDMRSRLQTLQEDLLTQANILGLANIPALSFDDPKVAMENLSMMRANNNVEVAALYDAQGKLFAAFTSPDSQAVVPPANRRDGAGIWTDTRWMQAWVTVTSQNETVGMVYLQVRHNLLQRLLEYVGVLIVVLGSSLFAALMLANRMQTTLTTPLLAISGVARKILETNDFSLRAPKKSDDEIGTLVDLFNSMLDELGHRARILMRANNALRSSDDRYQLAVRGSSAGLWDWDMVAGTTFYSPRFKALLGYTHEEFPDLPESLAQVLHTDDRIAVRDALREHLSQDKPYQVECRLRLKSGEWRWFLIAGMAEKDAMGKAFRMAGSVIEVTERKEAEQILQDANRAKDEFLATLAHELRNPLAPIRTCLQILKKDANNGAASEHAREVMERQLAHMVRLIDDLLDISRINSGKISIERSRIRLAGAIETAVEISRPVIAGKDHKLTLDLPALDIELMADGTRLAQALGNLLNNAGKYTPEGGQIHLKAWQESGTAIIEISDSGVGIPSGMLENIFTIFTQVTRTLDRSQGGLGIGLYLVRSLVELHGGSITAASAGFNKGSTFTLRIPCLLASPTPPAAYSVDDAPVQEAAPLSVLVVDDNVDAAETLLAVLRMDGHSVSAVFDGPSVLAAAELCSPDVVLLDIGLPGMNGYEVARKLRADPRFSRTLLVAITGWGSENDKKLALEAGFDRHLTKPVDLALLEAMLGEAAAGNMRAFE